MRYILLLIFALSLYSCEAQKTICQHQQTNTGTTSDYILKTRSSCNLDEKMSIADFLSHYSIGTGGSPSGVNKLQYDSAGHFGGAKIGYVELFSQPFFFYDSTQTFTISQNNAKTLIRLDSNLLLLKSAGFTDTIPHVSGTLALTSQLPSLTKSRVAFGSTSNTITSDANFIYADTTGSGAFLATTFSLSLPGTAVVLLKDRKNLSTHQMQFGGGVFNSTISNTGVYADAYIQAPNSAIELDNNTTQDDITITTDSLMVFNVNGDAGTAGAVLMDLNGDNVFTEQPLSSCGHIFNVNEIHACGIFGNVTISSPVVISNLSGTGLALPIIDSLGNMVAGSLKNFGCTGQAFVATPISIVCPMCSVGDAVQSVMNSTTYIDLTSDFETKITIAGHIQQIAGSLATVVCYGNLLHKN